MRRIMLSFLCLLMHLLQDETTSLLISEKQDLQDSIKPQRVEFHSLNFNTTLHWQPGWAREARDTLYFVQHKVYGQSTWQNKDECWGISSHICDLTQETSATQEPYYGRVRAMLAGVYSNWSLSCRFTPWRESIFGAVGRTGVKTMKKKAFFFWWENREQSCVQWGHYAPHIYVFSRLQERTQKGKCKAYAVIGPPIVTVVHSNKSITVKLQAPRSPYKRRRGSKIPMTNYYDLLYQVFVINNLLDEQHRALVYEGKDKVIKIQDLRPGVSYCIVAKTYVPTLDRSSAYSSRQCTVLQ